MDDFIYGEPKPMAVMNSGETARITVAPAGSISIGSGGTLVVGKQAA